MQKKLRNYNKIKFKPTSLPSLSFLAEKREKEGTPIKIVLRRKDKQHRD